MSTVIVVAGEALVDLVIDPDGHVTAALGGAPFNTARALGRLGVDVGFLGAISNDRFGTMLAAQLERDGVDLALAPRVELPTTLAAAELDGRGTASYRFYIEGTSAPALTAAPAGLLPDVLFTGGLGLVLQPMASVIEPLVAACHGHPGTTVMVDVNCRPKIVPDRDDYTGRVCRVVAGADIVKVSDEDLHYLEPELEPLDAACRLLALGPSAVLVTAGGRSVHVLTADARIEVPVEPVTVVDTIGAGDTFGAGFMAWWSASGFGAEELDRVELLEAAVRAASAAAAVVCGRRGADPPWRRELAPDWAP
jgi:fructokinase